MLIKMLISRALWLGLMLWASMSSAFGTDQALSPNSETNSLDELLTAFGGKLPPPKELFKAIQSNPNLNVTEILATVLPKGRSLQAPFTTLEKPRSVMTFRTRENGPRIYIGYSPGKNELEIIAQNLKTNEYEFALVKNYGTATPALIERNVGNQCVSCHQSRRPIFSVFPWSETTENPRILAALEKVKSKLDPIATVILNGKEPSGLPRQKPPFVLNSPFAIDQTIGSEVGDLNRKEICKRICQQDPDCRKAALILHLNQGGLDRRLKNTKYNHATATRTFLHRLNSLYSDGRFTDFAETVRLKVNGKSRRFLKIKLPSTFISDRAPLDKKGRLLPHHQFGKNSGPAVHTTFGVTGDVYFASADPRAPRYELVPLEVEDFDRSSSSFLVASCMPAFDEEFPKFGIERPSVLQAIDPALLEARLDRPELKQFLNQWPPRQDKILAWLKTADPLCLDVSATAPLDVPKKNSLVRMNHAIQNLGQQERALELLRLSCTECHQSKSPGLAMYLPFDDLKRMSSFKGRNPGATPLNYLKQEFMPPIGAIYKLAPGDRQILIEALSGK